LVQARRIVEPNRIRLQEITWLIDSGAICPTVGGIFLLAGARQAYQQKPAHGKAVLQVVAAE
jgi:hypothetical protein